MPKKAKERKGKKERKKHPAPPKSKQYELKEGKAERKRRFCPKCGPGVFMAKHTGRLTCGKCGYTEWEKAGEAKEKESTPPRGN